MRATLVVCLVVGCVAFAEAASAQTATGGSVRGFAKDEQDAVLKDVRITATSPDEPQSHDAVTDEGGFYRVLDLPPGTYNISAELDGFTKWIREGIVIRAGLNITVPIQMKVGTIAETVTVRLETPMLEISKPVQAFNIAGELQRSLPVSQRRSWSDALYLLPGTVKNEPASGQNGFFTVHGATNASNVQQLDGVNMDSAAQAAFNFVAINVDAIADVRIKTAATDAATPLGWGAVMSVVTKSGTNHVRGAATITVQPKAWLGNNAPSGTTAGAASVQPDLSAGGPVLRDRAWFFGAFRYTYNRRSVDRTATQLTNLTGLVPSFRPFGAETRAPLYFAKATSALGRRHRLSLSYLYDRFPSESVSPMDASPFLTVTAGGPAVTGRLTSTWSAQWLSEVTIAYDTKGQSLDLLDEGPTSRVVYPSARLSGGRWTATGPIATLDNAAGGGSITNAAKTTIAATSTYFTSGLLGSHEFQFGVHLQPGMRHDVIQIFPNNGFALEDVMLRNANDPASGVIPFHRRIYDAATFTNSSQRRSDNAVFVQDNWRPLPALSVSAGVRLDVVRRTDRVFALETEDSTNLGPRFGATYAFGPALTNTLRGHWGRVHELVSRQSLSAGTSTIGFRDLYDLDLNGTFETTFGQPGATVRSANQTFDPDYHQPFLDEWSAGYRRQLPGQMTLDVNLLRRAFKDRHATIDVNAIYEDRVFKGYRDVSQRAIMRVTNDVWTTPIYTAVEATVTKQTSTLQLLAAYTRQWHRLEGVWRPNDPAAIIQPDAFANERGVEVAAPASSYSTAINEAARDHLVRLAANCNTIWNLSFAGSYSFQSGHWSGPVLLQLPAGDPVFGPPTVTLPNGAVVSNPLNTPTRFAFATRAEGQFKLDGVHVVNLRVARRFPLGRHAMTTAIDVFNVSNLGGFQFLSATGNQQASTSYKTGMSRQLPRSVQVSLGIQF